MAADAGAFGRRGYHARDRKRRDADQGVWAGPGRRHQRPDDKNDGNDKNDKDWGRAWKRRGSPPRPFSGQTPPTKRVRGHSSEPVPSQLRERERALILREMQINQREEDMEKEVFELRMKSERLAVMEKRLVDREAAVAADKEESRCALDKAVAAEDRTTKLKESLNDAVSAEAFASSMSKLFGDFVVAGMAKLVAHERVDEAAKVAAGTWSTLVAAGGGHAKSAAEEAMERPHPDIVEVDDHGAALKEAVMGALGAADRSLVEAEVEERGFLEERILAGGDATFGSEDFDL